MKLTLRSGKLALSDLRRALGPDGFSVPGWRGRRSDGTG